MKNLSTWILTISGVLYNHVMCLNDYEVFHGSDPYHHHDDYNQENAEQKEYDLSGFKSISPKPKFTSTHLYISPENAEPHFARSPTKNSYNDGYSAFLQKNFQNYDDNDDEEVNSKYQQNYDDEDEEDLNSKYQQKNEEDNDNDDETETNSKYQHAPKDVQENEHQYYDPYGFERIQSLSQKEEAKSKQSFKNCKVIVKGKAMCRLCKDPVSGAHSESCEFSSALPEKKYAYIMKEKYIS